ncbi:hypothetical protein [Streptomyces sp. NPDC002054]|uniref:hypothetical protein n=1 Tax=Streptomyces sp. NPDC002054 TaxID=3154663 RepID=UPI003317D2A5
MSATEEGVEPPAAGMAAVLAVLAPVLTGTAALIFLGVGYALTLLTPDPDVSSTMVLMGWLFSGATVLSLLVAMLGLLITALRTASPVVGSRAADRTLGFATFVAGARRAHLREEWAALLAGEPENDVVLSSRRRMAYALGFLWAAVRLRVHDLTRPCWRPVDWLLAVESRTNRFIALAVGGQAVYIVGSGGIPALVTEIWEPCGLFGGGLYVLSRWLRRVRGIELATVRDDPLEDESRHRSG